MVTYKTGAALGSMGPEDAQKKGLGSAYNIATNGLNKTQTYPGDISGTLQGPATGAYHQNQAYKPMERVQGLMGGDYESLQKSLEAPILDQARQSTNQIRDVYSANGLYGSVGGNLMSGAMAGSQQATQNALSNAVASRYNLQLEDQAQQMGQNRDLFAANAAATDQQNNYNKDKVAWDLAQSQKQIDFGNAQKQMAQQYALDQQNWQNSVDEVNFQRMLQLAGLGNSGTATANQYAIGKQQANAAENAAMWQGIGSVAGGLMGSYDQSGNSGWNFSGAWDGLTGLF